MKNVLRVLVITLLLASLCCPLSFGAEFRLKSGDSVTGELMSYDGTTFRVKNKFGVLSIEASELAVIGINSEEGIVDIALGTPTSEDRDRIKGTIEYVREGEVKIKTEYGYVVVNPLDKAAGIFLAEDAVGEMVETGVTTPQTQLKTQQTVEAKGFTFALQGCGREGENVACHFLITSTEQDRRLTLYGNYLGNSSYILDNFGDDYHATEVTLGSESRDFIYRATFFADVPIQATFSFEDVSSQAEAINMFVMLCAEYSNDKKFAVKFSNLSFSE